LAAAVGWAAAASGAEAPRARVMLIGIDAASWNVIDPLLAEGRMPHLKRLMEGGSQAVLRSVTSNSPVEWTTIFTGKSADKHGIHGWNPVYGEPRTTDRKVKAVWNILAERGRRVAVVGLMGTYPVERVPGAFVSNTWPKRWETELDGYFHPTRLVAGGETYGLRAFLDGYTRPGREAPPVTTREGAADVRLWKLYDALARDERAATLAEHAFGLERYDLLATFLSGADSVGHVVWLDVEAVGDVVRAYYVHLDSLLGRLLRFADERTVVVVVSDHGQQRLRDYQFVRGWNVRMLGNHLDDGVLVVSGAGAARSAIRGEASTYDVVPTILRLAGLPPAADMDGRVLDGMLGAAYASATAPTVPTYETGTPSFAEPVPASPDPETVRRLKGLGYLR
jgi:predicted AlkP superfamily phosphohydrolase/phosphomutase